MFQAPAANIRHQVWRQHRPDRPDLPKLLPMVSCENWRAARGTMCRVMVEQQQPGVGVRPCALPEGHLPATALEAAQRVVGAKLGQRAIRPNTSAHADSDKIAFSQCCQRLVERPSSTSCTDPTFRLRTSRQRAPPRKSAPKRARSRERPSKAWGLAAARLRWISCRPSFGPATCDPPGIDVLQSCLSDADPLWRRSSSTFGTRTRSCASHRTRRLWLPARTPPQWVVGIGRVWGVCSGRLRSPLKAHGRSEVRSGCRSDLLSGSGRSRLGSRRHRSVLPARILARKPAPRAPGQSGVKRLRAFLPHSRNAHA